MFDPSQADVRRFFCQTWRKHLAGEILAPIEVMALDAIEVHSEYHDDLADEARAIAAEYSIDTGRTNPFLHLSMHLAIAEQLSIDQPPGIRAVHDALLRRTDSPHDAAHIIMECLGRIVWDAQRTGQTPDSEAYLDALRRTARPASTR